MIMTLLLNFDNKSLAFWDVLFCCVSQEKGKAKARQ